VLMAVRRASSPDCTGFPFESSLHPGTDSRVKRYFSGAKWAQLLASLAIDAFPEDSLYNEFVEVIV